jgi:hypothetical protein
LYEYGISIFNDNVESYLGSDVENAAKFGNYKNKLSNNNSVSDVDVDK